MSKTTELGHNTRESLGAAGLAGRQVLKRIQESEMDVIDAWTEFGKALLVGKKLTENPDCGIAGKTHNHRFSKWMSQEKLTGFNTPALELLIIHPAERAAAIWAAASPAELQAVREKYPAIRTLRGLHEQSSYDQRIAAIKAQPVRQITPAPGLAAAAAAAPQVVVAPRHVTAPPAAKPKRSAAVIKEAEEMLDEWVRDTGYADLEARIAANRKALADIERELAREHRGIFTPSEMNLLKKALHPNGTLSDEQKDEAWRVFKAAEIPLAKEPTTLTLPKTREEMVARKTDVDAHKRTYGGSR